MTTKLKTSTKRIKNPPVELKLAVTSPKYFLQMQMTTKSTQCHFRINLLP
jgi:hypothetical protein